MYPDKTFDQSDVKVYEFLASEDASHLGARVSGIPAKALINSLKSLGLDHLQISGSLIFLLVREF
mgnify:FL=1